MGSSMKPTIFNDRVATALRNWHHTAKKHVKQSKHSAAATPASSHPVTPSHGISPVHLLRHYRSEVDSPHASPTNPNYYTEHSVEGSPLPPRLQYHIEIDEAEVENDHRRDTGSSSQVAPRHEIDVGAPTSRSTRERV